MKRENGHTWVFGILFHVNKVRLCAGHASTGSRHPWGISFGRMCITSQLHVQGACVQTHLWSHNSLTHPGAPGSMCVPCARIHGRVHVCDCMSDKLPGAGAPQEGSDGSLRHFSCARKTRLPFQEACPRKINSPRSWGSGAGAGDGEREKVTEPLQEVTSKAVTWYPLTHPLTPS